MAETWVGGQKLDVLIRDAGSARYYRETNLMLEAALWAATMSAGGELRIRDIDLARYSRADCELKTVIDEKTKERIMVAVIDAKSSR